MRIIELDGFGERRVIESDNYRKKAETIIAWCLKVDPPKQTAPLARFREGGGPWRYIDPDELLRRRKGV